MVQKTIKLSQIQDVYDFVALVTAFDGDADIVCGRYRVNAKSVMGIFSLDLTKPLNLEILRGNADKLVSALAPYLV